MNTIFTPYLIKNFEAVVGEDGVIPISAEPLPLKILTSSAQQAQWGSEGLPSDQVSLENGSILCNSSRWPLIIDPQLQGIKWLRNKEAHPDRNLAIVRLGQNDLLRKLERALEP